MVAMTPILTWQDAALRLGCTIVAAFLLGLNRSEHGKAAGLRTTMLVCLAASVAMLQVNALLPLSGRASDSFVMNDLMRLPLGILTGVGFIGGGAILRRESLVVGVTTAATLWYVTVIGLCFGGGQIMLGSAATALGLAILWGLKWIERLIRQERSSRLTLTLALEGPSESDICRRLHDAGLSIVGRSVAWVEAGRRREFVFDLREAHYPVDIATPAVVERLSTEAGVESLRWRTPA
jgi:putative Mg2+ transporter-C (MgtC) family protein